MQGLAEGGIRLTALGTGTPFVKRSQSSTGYLIQIGNGDNFIFDFGTGASLNLAALGIPLSNIDKVHAVIIFQNLTRHIRSSLNLARSDNKICTVLGQVFLSHLHSDHIGDLPFLAVAGTVYDRHTPLQIWGPSSDTPEKGTSATVDGLVRVCNAVLGIRLR